MCTVKFVVGLVITKPTLASELQPTSPAGHFVMKSFFVLVSEDRIRAWTVRVVPAFPSGLATSANTATRLQLDSTRLDSPTRLGEIRTMPTGL
jgi:hypothetical protein